MPNGSPRAGSAPLRSTTLPETSPPRLRVRWWRGPSRTAGCASSSGTATRPSSCLRSRLRPLRRRGRVRRGLQGQPPLSFRLRGLRQHLRGVVRSLGFDVTRLLRAFRREPPPSDRLVRGRLRRHHLGEGRMLSTCSAVRDTATQSSLWETCSHRLVDFTPHGRHVLGMGSSRSGIGADRIAVLDAADGRVVFELSSDELHQTSVAQLTWEDDSHALAVIYADGKWAVVRIGLDGSMEYAVPPRAEGSDLDRPFILQS